MKGKIKGLLLTISMVLVMFALTACGSEEPEVDSYESLAAEEVMNYKYSAQTLIEQIVTFSDEELEMYLTQPQVDDFTISALESWKKTKDSVGDFEEVTSQIITENVDIVTVSSQVEFEEADCTVNIVLNISEQMFTSMNFEVNETLGMKMQKAGMNTLIGIGIVFCMLLFLSFIISLFRFIAKFEAKVAAKKKAGESEAAAPEVVLAKEEEEFSDDEELVAVIAAAVAAYEGTSTDDFVVRSIRKSNKWKRA